MKVRLFKFPNYIQSNRTDCGPMSLKIIAKYFGKTLESTFLRELCSTTIDGTSIHSLCKGAETLGLHTHPSKISFDKFKKEAPLPAVIFWEENHFMVVYKISKRHVYISDPKKGLQKVSHPNFIEGWVNKESKLGLVIFLQPTAKFNEISNLQNNSVSAIRYIYSYLSIHKKHIVHLFSISILLAIISLMLPLLGRSIIDTGLISNDLEFIQIILIAHISLIIFKGLAEWLKTNLTIHVSSRIKIAIGSDFLYKLLNLPITFFETTLHGDIIQRTKDQERIQEFVMGSALTIFLSLLQLCIFASLLFYINTSLFYIFIISSVLYITLIAAYFGISKRLDTNFFQVLGKINSHSYEVLKNIDDIKINTHEDATRYKWEKLQAKLYKINIKTLNVANWKQLGSDLIIGTRDIFLIFTSTISVMKGEMTIGMMISIQFIIGLMYIPMNDIIRFFTSIQLAYLSYQRVAEVNTIKSERNFDTDISYFPEKKEISIKQILFSYPSSSEIAIKNINLKIQEGEFLGVSGESGSGKSTLLKIIARFYVQQHGDICIDGINTRNIDISKYRSRIGYAAHDSNLFNDTIAMNIAMQQKIESKKIYDILEIVNLKTEVNLLPNGIKTIIGENGKGLSSGQKQRIILARALYKDPDYLILDEATSALDQKNEIQILKEIRKKFPAKTLIMSSHRLSTLRLANNIVFLKNGSIVEYGPPESMMPKLN